MPTDHPQPPTPDGLTREQDEQQLAALIRATLGDNPPPFRPFADYHEGLDMLIVQTADVSDVEHQIDRRLAVLQDMYSPAIVGFHIYGIAHLAKTHGLSLPELKAFIEKLDQALAGPSLSTCPVCGLTSNAVPCPRCAGVDAREYLSRLLVHRAPQCEPLPDLLGVVSQIDNLLCGLQTIPAPRVTQE